MRNYKNVMKKVLLLIPPNKEGFIRDVQYGCWHKPKFIDYSWPPITEYQLYSILKNQFKVKIIDGSILSYNKVISLIQKFNPDYIICSTGTYTFADDITFLRKIKKRKQKIITYGELATLSPKVCLREKAIDYAIKGEPEAIILDLLTNEENKKFLTRLTGLCFKDHITRNSIFVKNLDNLPFPERDIHLATKYKNPFAIKRPFTTIIVTRGCPYSCIFCTVPVLYGKTFRKRTIKNITKEMKILKNQGFKELFFRDENLTLDKDFVKKLCQQIIREKLNFSWMCNSRIDTIDKETLYIMKKSGCHLIKFGVESGNQEILDNMNKKITLNQIKEAFYLCKEEKIDTLAHFMIGNLGDTKETIMETIQFAKELNPLYASFDIVLKYQGTKLSKMKKLTNINNSELEFYHDYAFKNFYIRPRLILRHIFAVKSYDQFKQKTIGTVKLWYKLLFK